MNCPTCVREEPTLGQPSKARWVGPDGEPYCSLHFRQRFGIGEVLVRIENYEPPAEIKPPSEPEKLPGTHAKLDALAAERGIDLGDAETVAEKQAVIEAAS